MTFPMILQSGNREVSSTYNMGDRDIESDMGIMWHLNKQVRNRIFTMKRSNHDIIGKAHYKLIVVEMLKDVFYDIGIYQYSDMYLILNELNFI